MAEKLQTASESGVGCNRLLGGVGRQKLGSFFVDTATLLLADPCKVIHDEDGAPISYDEFIELWDAGEQPANRDAVIQLPIPVHHEFVVLKDERGANGAIAVNVGSDGWYPVFFERDESGAERLVIELGGHVSE